MIPGFVADAASASIVTAPELSVTFIPSPSTIELTDPAMLDAGVDDTTPEVLIISTSSPEAAACSGMVSPLKTAELPDTITFFHSAMLFTRC